MMMRTRSIHMSSFKKSLGKIIKEDAIVASMPRIRISAAKNNSSSRNPSVKAKRSFFLEGAGQMIGGLTQGNL